MSSAAAEFDQLRPYLLGVAYRLTSSWADAEDVVADAWPRWAAHAEEVREPRAWLTRTVGRLALDLLTSARVRRESYVGPWLPEPLVARAAGDGSASDPAAVLVADESVRMAFLVVLDELTPEQRVAVVLHDVLGTDFGEVAEVLGTSVGNARQHAVRGRRRLTEADPAPRTASELGWQLLAELSAALASGDTDRLSRLLAPDVVLTGDGGGQVAAARKPIVGAAQVGRFLVGLGARFGDNVVLEAVWVNGDPGLMFRTTDPRPHDARAGVYAFSWRDGRIERLYGILAPDKLTRLPDAESI